MTTVNLEGPAVQPRRDHGALPPVTSPSLTLRAGDWVEVRSAQEILATLDPEGRLDALPFMPEMLAHCGKRFRIFKVAHKTCDTIKCFKARRMQNAVHLEGLRCDGSAHGGCQAGCLLFWKEAWLKRVDAPADETRAAAAPIKGNGCDVPALMRAAKTGEGPAARYRCQATELLRATAPLPWWQPRQYVQDVASGNFRSTQILRALAIHLFNKAQKLWGGTQYPFVRPRAKTTPQVERLNLQPGELVQVRSKEEIEATLRPGVQPQNRGLTFDVDMVSHCGRTFRVLRRVERLVNEKTGEMITIKNDCIILDGAVCTGLLSRNRVGCSRSLFPFWREIWLRRVGATPATGEPNGQSHQDLPDQQSI
jgi:hypothetical protein